MKHYIIIFGVLLTQLACRSVQISNAAIYESVAALPNLPHEVELTFSSTFEKNTNIEPEMILESDAKVIFRINTIYDKENTLLKPTATLAAGMYRFLATTEDKNFQGADNLTFFAKINGKKVTIKPVLKEKKRRR